MEVARKVCICGDPGVGKSSLVRRFVLQRYDDKYLSTLGTVVSKKSVAIPQLDCNMSLMIWDISGQAEFKRIHASAFSNSSGGFVVYDVLRPETLESVQGWIATMRQWAGEKVPITILANKTDLLPKSERPRAGTMLGCPSVPTSAKAGENVDDAFHSLGEAIAKLNGMPPIPTIGNAKIEDLPDKFESSGELLDFIAISLCKTLKDQEMGMHILRNQVTKSGIDFVHMRKADAEMLVDRLGEVVKDFKGGREGSDIRVRMHRAIERTKW
ncbi:MAG: Rab family GTPase [Methanobacteriota archaeon]